MKYGRGCRPMKALIGLAVMILMIGVPSVYAETAYRSGFKHGVADANIGERTGGNGNDYIHQPGKGFAFHTTAFVDGYIKGWCSTANIGGHGAGGIEPNDDPEPTLASFDCEKGLSSAYPHPMDWSANPS
jgi:hypothetical protein